MKNKFKIIIGIFILFTLNSCIYTKVQPTVSPSGVEDNTKIEEINNLVDVKIQNNEASKSNLLIREEIDDRKASYEKLNKNKEYLEQVKTNLDKKIITFKDQLEITRQLALADMKIVKAITDGFLDEKSINKNNYFYKYLKQNINNKSQILKDLNGLIKVFSSKELFDKYYYINLDLSKVDFMNLTSKKVFDYTNFYLKEVKYNKDIQSGLTKIITSLNILKLDKYKISETRGGFMSKGTSSYIYKTNLESLLKTIKG